MNIGIPNIPECNKKKTVEISENWNIFFIFHNSPMQQQHLCGTKTNLKVYQIVSFVDAMLMTVCFFKPTPRNESIISKSSTFAVSCATE